MDDGARFHGNASNASNANNVITADNIPSILGIAGDVGIDSIIPVRAILWFSWLDAFRGL
jgi:hypothetical protein